MSQRVFITGGASGLGRAVALRFAREGARVAVGDVDAEKGTAVAAEINDAGGDGVFLEVDVRRLEDLERAKEALVARWQGVDVVVNNAGVVAAGAVEDIALDDWEWILDINVLGVVRGCKAFTPLFKAQGAGTFVNVASMAGLMLTPLMSSYNVSKAGVIGLSETLHQELRDDGISVCLVCPAFFHTNLTSGMRAAIPGVEKKVNKLMQRSQVSADDVADGIYAAVQKGELWVLPHRRERRLWYLKRYAPRAFDWLMHRESRRWMHKMAGKGEASKPAGGG